MAALLADGPFPHACTKPALMSLNPRRLRQIKACNRVWPKVQAQHAEESMSEPATTPSSAGYASIMIPMDSEPDAQGRIRIAAALSDRFASRLIGVAAHPIVAPLYFETPVPGIASAIELEERQALREMAAAEAVFRRVCGSRGQIEWRQALALPGDYVLEHARAADLIVAGLPKRGAAVSPPMRIDAGDLVLGAGRPVLFGTEFLAARCMVIGWKDTRESRRAVADALPLLRQAAEVYVASFGSDPNGAKDVCSYLGCHGIHATLVHRPESGPVSDALLRLTEQEAADLIVCGAYGHSRTREWALGGVTYDLLNGSTVCCLMAH
jgi:nucleotide-binding universal stress UspA family protein